jgi:hypothetical protein
MIENQSPTWAAKIAYLAKANDYDINIVLGAMGEEIAGQLKNSINQLNSPPLAASTIKKKGFSKPLIDTAVMINSIGHEIKTGTS